MKNPELLIVFGEGDCLAMRWEGSLLFIVKLFILIEFFYKVHARTLITHVKA